MKNPGWWNRRFQTDPLMDHATLVPDCMERLMHVAHEVDEEL
ncbi:MAG: hypothetical protein ABR881_30075 [Candidatus Sulfotelmatobacter sp.]